MSTRKISHGEPMNREHEADRLAARYARRAEALERAVDAAASDGIPRDKLHAWLAKNGWTMSDDDGVFVWRRGEDEFFTFGDYIGLVVLLRDVKRLAGFHGRSLADVLEEIMVPS